MPNDEAKEKAYRESVSANSILNDCEDCLTRARKRYSKAIDELQTLCGGFDEMYAWVKERKEQQDAK